MAPTTLPLPPAVSPDRTDELFRVDYQRRAGEARAWAREHGIAPAEDDDVRIALLAVDVQNTFCLPGFELFVGGRSGTGAVDDNRRLCRFLYAHLHRITRVVATMDTHQALQIFHALLLVGPDGQHPAPNTQVTVDDVERGVWRFNAAAAPRLGIDPDYGQRHLEHYVRTLRERGKYALTVWPFHAMLGGVGHALVPAVEEAFFFHGAARYTEPEIVLKGRHPLTEHYSALGPEVETGPDGDRLEARHSDLLARLTDYDALIVAGQAQSHCVAWTVDDLLRGIQAVDPALADRVYLLDDATSPVVIPDVVDFTDQAERAYDRFAEAGMHRVRTTDPMETWPGMAQRLGG